MKRKRKKTKISYKKYRVILCDVLPYELPVTFSNRYFYRFLSENKIECTSDTVSWTKSDVALDAIMKIIMGAENDARIVSRKETHCGQPVLRNTLGLTDKCFQTIPFGYKIRHKESEFRDLAICHPRNQLQLVEFYHENKELILYFCNESPFSIRKPTRIAQFAFHKDRAHYAILSDDPDGIEEIDKEYENLRSFFVYADYSHIFKFYESDKFHACEKRYSKLLKLDISKCFASMYTHSVAWALLKKASVKEKMKLSKGTFAGEFDRIMQGVNYGETNGIIIGPEFSRIFAELILQAVDKEVCAKLSALTHRKDYEIFRYVDDYFLFFNEEEDKETIVRTLRFELQDYKLYLNDSKSVQYEKPIITNISMAKNRVVQLLNEKLVYKIEKAESAEQNVEADIAKPETKVGSIHIAPRALITEFKTIIREAGVDSKDTLNYALAVVEKKSRRIILDYETTTKTDESEKGLCQAIEGICDFTFFIFSISPRANTTIRLCKILQIFIAFLKRPEINADLKHSAFKLIFDNICLVMKKNKNSEHTPVETLYLLIVLSELGKDYWLDEETLCGFMDIRVREDGTFIPGVQLNYISLVVLLFYIKDKKAFAKLRSWLETLIVQKFESKKVTLRKDTELTLLLLDILPCPFVAPQCKSAILKCYGITNTALQNEIIGKRKYWFTKWTGFDFGKSLDAKQSREVY